MTLAWRWIKACAVFLLTGELPHDTHNAGRRIKAQALKQHEMRERSGAAVDPSAAGAQPGPCSREEKVRARLWQWWDAEMSDCHHTPEEWADLFQDFRSLAERETVDGWELNVQGRE